MCFKVLFIYSVWLMDMLDNGPCSFPALWEACNRSWHEHLFIYLFFGWEYLNQGRWLCLSAFCYYNKWLYNQFIKRKVYVPYKLWRVQLRISGHVILGLWGHMREGVWGRGKPVTYVCLESRRKIRVPQFSSRAQPPPRAPGRDFTHGPLWAMPGPSCSLGKCYWAKSFQSW